MQDIPDLLEGLRQSTNILSALVGSVADETAVKTNIPDISRF
jgi:hypothetical protein